MTLSPIKLSFCAFFSILCCLPSFGQRKLLKKVEEMNALMKGYATISHFSDQYLNRYQHPFSLEEYQNQIEQGEIEEYLNSENDSLIDNFMVIGAYQDRYDSLLQEIVRHPKFLEMDMESMLKTNHTISPDRKLWCFNLPAKNGGTYREVYSTWVYFNNEKVMFDYSSNTESEGYYAIDTLQYDGEILYGLSSYIRGCSYCFYYGFELMKCHETGFKQQFRTGVESRDWNHTVYFVDSTNTLTLEYTADDLNGGCDCGYFTEDHSYEEDYTYDTACKEIYRFVNGAFELVEYSMKKSK